MMITQLLRELRKRAGSAIWLLELLLTFAPGTWGRDTYLLIPGAVSDAQLGLWLGVKTRTIEAWRRRLRAAGLLDWTVKPGVGRVFVVASLIDKGFLEGRKPEVATETKPAEAIQRADRKADTEPLASRFVQ